MKPPPQEQLLSEIEICYVAALLDGLRLIDEKASELGVEPQIDANALMMYVAKKGDLIRQLCGIT